MDLGRDPSEIGEKIRANLNFIHPCLHIEAAASTSP